jgi:hypothetical protein
MTALRQHLVFLLNKLNRVLVNNPAMYLLYTGVEGGVNFPAHLDEDTLVGLHSTPSPVECGGDHATPTEE